MVDLPEPELARIAARGSQLARLPSLEEAYRSALDSGRNTLVVWAEALARRDARRKAAQRSAAITPFDRWRALVPERDAQAFEQRTEELLIALDEKKPRSSALRRVAETVESTDPFRRLAEEAARWTGENLESITQGVAAARELGWRRFVSAERTGGRSSRHTTAPVRGITWFSEEYLRSLGQVRVKPVAVQAMTFQDRLRDKSRADLEAMRDALEHGVDELHLEAACELLRLESRCKNLLEAGIAGQRLWDGGMHPDAFLNEKAYALAGSLALEEQIYELERAHPHRPQDKPQVPRHAVEQNARVPAGGPDDGQGIG